MTRCELPIYHLDVVFQAHAMAVFVQIIMEYIEKKLCTMAARLKSCCKFPCTV